MVKFSSKMPAVLFDGLVFLLLALWAIGGISIGGGPPIPYGVDTRRVATGLLVVGNFVPWLRQRSLLITGCRGILQRLLDSGPRRVVLAIGFAIACLSALSQTFAFRFPLYDVGLYHQVIWGVAHGHGFVSTISGAGNYLGDHFSLSYILLAPFFWLSGSAPYTLPIMHCVLTFLGIGAWLFLAERLPGVAPVTRGRLARATLLFAIGFDSLWGNLFWGFHDTAIGFAALSWALALYFVYDQGAVKCSKAVFAGILGLFAVAAFAKETFLLDGCLAMVVMAAAHRRDRSRWRMLTYGSLSILFLSFFILFELMPHPADKNYFARYYSYLGNTLPAFVMTLLLRPWVVFQTIGAGELLRFFLTVFAPFLLLPLGWVVWSRDAWRSRRLLRSPGWWLLVIGPGFLSLAVSLHGDLRGNHFHYVIALWPVLATLTILALGQWDERPVGWGRYRLSTLWFLLAWLMLGRDPLMNIHKSLGGISLNASSHRFFSNIPAQDSLSADEMAGPWAANRLAVTRWPELAIFNGQCPQWIALRRESQERAFDKGCIEPGSTPAFSDSAWVAFRTDDSKAVFKLLGPNIPVPMPAAK